MRPIVYASIDGVLDHIGYSQVVRVVEALAERGLPMGLVSLERTRDLNDAARVAALRARLEARGIRWHHDAYREGGGGARAIENVALLTALLARAVGGSRAAVVHARGYHGALAARTVRATLRTRYVFDARGFWIDERIEERRWFTTPTRLAVARRVESRLYRDAARVVTLTELHADHLRALHGPSFASPIVIPTVADYDAFAQGRIHAAAVVPEAVRARLAGRRVVAIIGSLNRAYLGPESARLARAVIDRDPEARILVLTGQRDAWARCLAEAGVPPELTCIERAAHEDMPSWLALADASLLLLARDSVGLRGAMPTKLAELFAAGVRPVVHGCNAEVRSWVARAGSGVVLEDVEPASLARAADRIVEGASAEVRERAREITRPHFSLAAGVSRYEALHRELQR